MDTMTSTQLQQDIMLKDTVKTSMVQDQVKTEYHNTTDTCHQKSAQLAIPGFDPH